MLTFHADPPVDPVANERHEGNAAQPRTGVPDRVESSKEEVREVGVVEDVVHAIGADAQHQAQESASDWLS